MATSTSGGYTICLQEPTSKAILIPFLKGALMLSILLMSLRVLWMVRAVGI